MTINARPRAGYTVRTAEKHPDGASIKVGVVSVIEKNICLFVGENGETNRFVWNFPEGLNQFFTWGKE